MRAPNIPESHPVPSPERRQFLKGSAAMALTISGGALLHSHEAWGLEVKNLKPATMRTLVQMARDIYPHDRIADRFYAIAVKGFDDDAATDANRKLVEDGIATLNAAARKAQKADYTGVGWESDRHAILKTIEKTPLFQKLRGKLVVSLYNQKEVWPLFGYEGESASKGGYINRGFNDITWL